MATELHALIIEYQRQVSEACRLLREKLQVQDLRRAWLTNALPERGWLDDEHKWRFHFHGVGCRVTFGEDIVDFDFRPYGRLDGFDAWRLALFAATAPQFERFRDVDSLTEELQTLERAGALVHLHGAMSDHLYYFADAVTR